VTDEGGAFETSLLTPGVYRLGAMAPGRMPGTIEKLDLRTASRRDLRVTLPPGGGIVVRLVDGSRNPVPSQEVVFVHEDGVVQEVGTDEKGVAALEPARTGRWAVAWLSRTVRGAMNPRPAPGATGPVPAPTAQQMYDVVRIQSGAEEVAVSDGTRLERTLRLPRLVRVKGRARFDGRVPTGARIGIWTGATWTQGALDADGRFEFQNVEPGLSWVYMSVPTDEGAPWQNRQVQVPDVIEHTVDLEFGK
jgi:hypothetical protein